MLQALCNILSRTPIQKRDWKQLHLHSLVRSPVERGHEELQRYYYLKQTRCLENKQVWKHYKIDAYSSLLTSPMQLAKNPPHTLKLCIFVHGYFLVCSNSHFFVKVARVKNSYVSACQLHLLRRGCSPATAASTAVLWNLAIWHHLKQVLTFTIHHEASFNEEFFILWFLKHCSKNINLNICYYAPISGKKKEEGEKCNFKIKSFLKWQ